MARKTGTARIRETGKALGAAARRTARLCAAAGLRPLSIRLDLRENTLRIQAEVRAGNLTVCLDAAWGRERFFRLETGTPVP